MPPAHFKVQEHVIDASHIREFPAATSPPGTDVTLRLSVKQYTPLQPLAVPHRNPPITILGGHANGIPREALEPLWDDLLLELRAQGGDIRAVWFVDAANHGASGVLNEHVLGEETHWFDHARDMMHVVNHFRSHIARPVVGVAHSMGCAHLVHLSAMHPRLLAALVLIEPVIQDTVVDGPNAATMATSRPDLWPSQPAAEKSVRASRLYRSWDPRALDAHVLNMFRPTPTSLYPDSPAGSVTLTTTKHQEAWAYSRANFEVIGDVVADRRLNPVHWANQLGQQVSYPTEYVLAWHDLPHLRPYVFWMFGARSPYSKPTVVEDKLRATGTGVGGSGGVESGQVTHRVFSSHGHFVAYEAPRAIAAESASWLAKMVLPKFVSDEAFWREYRSRKSKPGHQGMSDEWIALMKQPTDAKRVSVKVTKL